MLECEPPLTLALLAAVADELRPRLEQVVGSNNPFSLIGRLSDAIFRRIGIPREMLCNDRLDFLYEPSQEVHYEVDVVLNENRPAAAIKLDLVVGPDGVKSADDVAQRIRDKVDSQMFSALAWDMCKPVK